MLSCWSLSVSPYEIIHDYDIKVVRESGVEGHTSSTRPNATLRYPFLVVGVPSVEAVLS